ncbi:hypothetical protein PLESTB_000439100 [Pleodorina starrii]|uniref:Uncharacterized protein n=1 Tax=Pleodorina starrii TaxID=330485 RepID=A0A9W6BEX4_9CHLO|nr:hypothetical protein PLESTM_000932800 [Pleodorina starrii]GLC50854.1 hypothetical protein PLESTB_000439100 [Pleodorina starrii]GLC73951.1 hypothetical protein PLESTF_001441300 [Pleodorina starrii]
MPPAATRPAPQPEALKWKLIGAAAWHAAAISVTNIIFAAVVLPPSLGSLVRPSGVLAHIFLYLLQLASLLGHRLVLSSHEFEPVTFAKLGIHGRTWISLFLTRVVARGRSWNSSIATAGFFGANILTAVAYTALYGRLKVGPQAVPGTWSLWFGVLLAMWYSCSHLLRGMDVLAYPALQRHRWFRLKERVPAALLAAAASAAVALAASVAARQSLLLHPRLLFGWAVSGTLCGLGWVLGGALLQIVFSERMQLAQFGDADPNAPLLAELASSNTFMQDLALMDLAFTAEGQGGEAAWRRCAIFADESGRAAWGPLAAYMLAEVRDFTTALAAALPSAAAEAAAATKPRAGGAAAAAAAAATVRWNVLRMSPSTGLRVVSREQDLAAWNVRSKFHRIGWCLRGLCGLTVAAQRGEDRYGVVLLCEPALPDIAAGLLSAVLALQQYTKFVTATRSRQTSSLERLARHVGLVSTAIAGRVTNVTLQPVEEVAFALEAAARNTMHRLAIAYGDKLRECVQREARAKPAYGTAADLATLLTSMLG